MSKDRFVMRITKRLADLADDRLLHLVDSHVRRHVNEPIMFIPWTRMFHQVALRIYTRSYEIINDG